MGSDTFQHASVCANAAVPQDSCPQRVQSLPRWHRLTRRPDFTLCYEAGRRYFSRYFVLFVYQRQDGPDGWRMGLAVTKKVGNAVARNRIKRVLRAFFRLHQHLLPERMDIVAVPKRHLDVAQVNLHFVTAELSAVLDACTRARTGAS
ncbi:MAG: ribonuclease P protein component [Desulfovibrionaceae bacterium]